MEKINERDYYLNLEKDIIKDILLSKIRNDGHQELLELYLRQTMNVNNELVREYFDSDAGRNYNPNILSKTGTIDNLLEEYNKQEKPVKGLMNDSFYECFYNYIQLSNLKEKLKERYSINDDLECREREIIFVTNYNVSKRLSEITGDKWVSERIAFEKYRYLGKNTMLDLITEHNSESNYCLTI